MSASGYTFSPFVSPFAKDDDRNFRVHLTGDFEIISLAVVAVAAFVILISISFSALVWFIKELAGGNKTLKPRQ